MLFTYIRLSHASHEKIASSMKLLKVLGYSLFQFSTNFPKVDNSLFLKFTLESVIDVEQGINVGTGKFVKKNKCRALNKHRA